MLKRLAQKEERLTEWLIDRWSTKEPESFWEEDVPSHRWEAWILKHWPHKLGFNYWYYLFDGLGKGDWGNRLPWINLWSPITDLYEMKYWFKERRWRPVFLFEETKGERLICRMRGHPEGEIYYNPGGLEPDHHCKTCGEEIG